MSGAKRVGNVMRKQNRFIVLALAGLALSCGSSTVRKGDLSVTATPTGETDGPIKVVLSFSRTMIASDHVGDVLEQPLVAFSPNIAGEARWEDDKTMVFIPSSNLPVSTAFVAKVAKGTKALDGNQLPSAHTFEFASERITAAVDVLGSSERATQDQRVQLHFNHEVPFSSIEDHCKYVSGSSQHTVKLGEDSDSGPGRVYTVVPTGELSKDTDWKLSCAMALQGTVGNLGIEEDVEEEFRTFGPLSFISQKPTGDDVVPEEGLSLELAFTNPLKPPYKLSISPKVRGFPERCHSLGYAPPGLSCNVMLEARTSYKVTVPADQEDIFGQTLGSNVETQFRTSDAEPTISMDSGYFVAELKRPVLPIWTRNITKLEVTAVKVTQANFQKLQPMLNWWDNSAVDFDNIKLKAKSKTLAVKGKKNHWHQYAMDPAGLFGKEAGPGMYYLEVRSDEVDSYPYTNDGVRKTLVNFTDIGAVSKLSRSRGLVWVTTLSTGESLAQATVKVQNSLGKTTWTGRTDAEGVAILPGEKKLTGKGEAGSLRVYVSNGGDWTMVDPRKTGGLASWNFNVTSDDHYGPTRSQISLRGFMHSDRGLYRPGETVHMKGLARVSSLGERLKIPKSQKVKLEIAGPRGKTFHTANVRLSKFGGFWTDIELPGDARLGDYRVSATLEEGTFTQRFAVEEYRPASFEVTGKASKKRLVRRGTITASVLAKYLYGAPVREGDVDITVHSRPRYVHFPKHEDFDFDDERRYDSYYSSSSSYSQQLITEDTVGLDHEGNANIDVTVSPSDINSDADLLVRASVTAPSNEVINKTFTIPYFRSRRYYGIKSPGYFLEVKKPQQFEVIGVNPAGKAIDGEAKLTVTKRGWNCVWEDWGYRGSYQCKENKQTIMEKTIQMVDGKPAKFEFTPDGGGNYWVVVEGPKDNFAPAAQQLYAWGDGGGSWRSDDSMTFDVIADKKEYKAGDTATLILKTDLAKAKGLVTIERDGVIEKRFIDITPTMKHIKVPITAEYAPNVYVSVALVQGRMGEGRRGKPRMRMGLVNLPVRPDDNTLKVSVSTDAKDYRPGAPVTATVKVTDASGAPVAAEVALTAADEGVLSLIGYKTPNPVPTFYSPWPIGVTTATQFAYLRDIPGPNTERPATGGDAGGPGSVRSRFMSTAIWKPGVVTNAEGVATVSFKAPDNLTAFRVMAVAADNGYRFGSSDKRFTVSKPLQLHRVLPRFLTQGDTLQGGVVVHNETGKGGTATVTLRIDGLLAVKGDKKKTVTVAPGGRVPVLFELEALDLGKSKLTFAVKMNGESDAVEFKLPIHHPSSLLKTHIAHGASTGDKSISLELPPDAIPSTAELHISVDPDGLAGIEDGLRALVGYPYGCLEQTTSKVIPMIAVRGLAEGLNLDELKGGRLDEYVKAGVAKIGRHQTAYGGFSLYPGGHPQAYYTAYALWGLQLAKEAGYPVDSTRIDEGLRYLANDGLNPDTSKGYYAKLGNSGNQAFSLYVRSMYGDKDTQAATKLAEDLTKLPVYGKAFLARAMAADLGPKDPAVRALVDELQSIAVSATNRNELITEPDQANLHYYMSSSMRTTAIVLDALVALDPGNEVINSLVRTLMQKRRGKRYITTQANLFSLLALDHYSKSLQSRAPSVVVSIGDQELISATLKGKQRLKMATTAIPKGITSLSIRSKGEVNYNVNLSYRQRKDTIKAQSNGLNLTRQYLDESGKEKTEYKVGDVVLVKLTMPMDRNMSHLMVSDRIPAGFEALNTRLKTVGRVGITQTRSYWGGHREMRDERVDFSSEYNWRSTYVRKYMIRAIAEGHFAVPPSHAELMYEPEKNAQTALHYIDIKPKKAR